MPPAPKASNVPKRKGPAFKPPRPVNSSTTTAQRGPAATTSRVSGPAKRTSAAGAGLQPSLTLISDSEDEDDEQDALSQSDRDELMEDATEVEHTSILQPQLDPIPEKLLARLLYEGFEDKDMKIQKGAMELVGKYMEIFVREAVARARFERSEARQGGSHMDGYLQVEDLEKLAPQLVLDF
ncbi:hypothetical protein BU24DRAFT_51051 [Aaosphaeria arxii CBS 175.79]|uniref:Uncharacterized protein n=1 Tax=Aaosphaeria arxii CBS 175.79 TaxID=1450172 RepID=A0A6A5XF54_9PLEO|nr:uncharacterized protein BU24DRAFT_51051 [Aaosphaeria arxii CBS 175.79]KAF2011014.1 hypothetical protein BU24DRAFT_51051 [Aaosphaeria arxii CBS 175.79]